MERIGMLLAWLRRYTRAYAREAHRFVCRDPRVILCAKREIGNQFDASDKHLCARFGALQWVQPSHLGIPLELEGALTPALAQRVSEALRRAMAAEMPSEKAEGVTCACNIVSVAISDRRGGTAVAADDFLPCFIWTVLRSRPSNALANIAFVEALHDPDALLSEDGFCLTHLKSAAEFALRASGADLGFAPEEFDRRVAASRRAHSRSDAGGVGAHAPPGTAVVLNGARIELRCAETELLLVDAHSGAIAFRFAWSRVLRWRAEGPAWEESGSASRSTLRVWVWADGVDAAAALNGSAMLRLECCGPHGALTLAAQLLACVGGRLESASRGASAVELCTALLMKGSGARRRWTDRHLELQRGGHLAFWANAASRANGDAPRGSVALRGCSVSPVVCAKKKYFHRFVVEPIGWHFRAESEAHRRALLSCLVGAGALGRADGK